MISRFAAAGILLLGGVLGAAIFWYVDQQESVETPDTNAVEVIMSSVQAETRDLESYEEWAGTLQSGTTASITASARGTLTQTVDVGTRIDLGDVAAEIDGMPVIVLYGSVPQFRELEINSDDGADIRQLEENLVALGYDPDGSVTVDENFTVNTGSMVERWEIDLGLDEPDTVVAAGQIAFIDGPSEVASRTTLGSQMNPGQVLLSTVTLATSGFVDAEADVPDDAFLAQTYDVENGEIGRPLFRWESPQGGIELAVNVDDAETFPSGATVQVELPDGQVVDATVDAVSEVARTIQEGQDTVTVVDVSIEPVTPIRSDFTAGPVTIRVKEETIQGATMIPVRALVALSDGGHGVEVEGRGFVAVELGVFDDGWVEVTNGAIDVDEMLVVPG